MYNILVHTQTLENYGDEEKPWWKFKGGSTILVLGVSKQANAMALVALKYSGSEYKYYKELPIQWNEVGDDFVPGKDWDGPDFVSEVWDADGNQIESHGWTPSSLGDVTSKD